MDVVWLCSQGSPVRAYHFVAGHLEVGRAPHCDIAVPDAAIGERHLVVERRGHGVVVRGGGRDRELRPGHRHDLDGRYSLLYAPAAPEERRTEEVRETYDGPAGPCWVRIGSSREGRKRPIEGAFYVGSDPSCDLRVVDRTVSAWHCRLSRAPGGVFVRDLGSRNGTYVEGMRIVAACAAPGSRLRVGRTVLEVLGAEAGEAQIVAESDAMRRALHEAKRLAALDWPVLVLGESGTGKEAVARLLHEDGPRAHKPFVALNAASFTRDLVRSELFGHERGAFTGATSMHRGAFERAEGGTLFLDEIGELPLDVQAQLLRVLETGMVLRVGGETEVPWTARVVAATHRDLARRARVGTFRSDLFYRLARFVIELAPLRERPEDVVALAARFLAQMAGEIGPRSLSEDALAALLAMPLHGNARELRNLLSTAAIGASSPLLDASDIARAAAVAGSIALDSDSVARALEAHEGNISAAARTLGIPRSTLRDRARKSRGSTTSSA